MPNTPLDVVPAQTAAFSLRVCGGSAPSGALAQVHPKAPGDAGAAEGPPIHA